jgi:integrase
MIKVDLKGVHAVRTKRGRKIYYYAWRNGPPLEGKPGSPEFVASYWEAYESLKVVDTDRFRSIVVQCKAEPFLKLAASTRSKWAPWLDRIGKDFGDLRIAQFDRAEKIRPVIRHWRNRWQDKPRTADYGMQVLSWVLSYAVELGKIASNPCEGIKRLYEADRSEIIWQDADIDLLKKTCAAEVSHAVDLAAHTGLRLGDLLRLSWSHIGDDAIRITTGKSNHRRTAVIPLYGTLREILARIPKRATTVLTSTKGRPWTVNGFGTAFDRAKRAAGMMDRNLHFHDLRGTAATRFYVATIEERVIAEIMGWEEAQVHKILRRYVGQNVATEALLRKLNSAKSET